MYPRLALKGGGWVIAGLDIFIQFIRRPMVPVL